jgi:hypothetical protein
MDWSFVWLVSEQVIWLAFQNCAQAVKRRDADFIQFTPPQASCHCGGETRGILKLIGVLNPSTLGYLLNLNDDHRLILALVPVYLNGNSLLIFLYL